MIIETGVQLLVALINGLAEAIPQLIDYIPQIIRFILQQQIISIVLIQQ